VSIGPRSERPVSLLEWTVFGTLVAIVTIIILVTQGATIHNTFTNITTAWNQG
jgi:Flp pilus assembly pilin Flp